LYAPHGRGTDNAFIDPVAGPPELKRLIDAGVPSAALAFYGRWWQLENWLRDVAYVELRAQYGVDWVDHLQAATIKRRSAGRQSAYMASADDDHPLAYADVSALFKLIEDEWDLFSALLPPLQRWRGRADELRELRNRNAHCRRPHADDIVRLEQALRDLERGAWLFYSSYADTEVVPDSRDPVARAWVKRRHPTAERLLDSGHAERKYETRFWLKRSVRPWASAPDLNKITGTPGVLWHARWFVAGHELNVANLWRQLLCHGETRRYVIHLLFDLGSIVATFAAVDDPQAVADAIGGVFDAILESTRPFRHIQEKEWEQRSFRGADSLPRLVQVQSPFTAVDPYQPPVSLFDA